MKKNQEEKRKRGSNVLACKEERGSWFRSGKTWGIHLRRRTHERIEMLFRNDKMTSFFSVAAQYYEWLEKEKKKDRWRKWLKMYRLNFFFSLPLICVSLTIPWSLSFGFFVYHPLHHHHEDHSRGEDWEKKRKRRRKEDVGVIVFLWLNISSFILSPLKNLTDSRSRNILVHTRSPPSRDIANHFWFSRVVSWSLTLLILIPRLPVSISDSLLILEGRHPSFRLLFLFHLSFSKDPDLNCVLGISCKLSLF